MVWRYKKPSAKQAKSGRDLSRISELKRFLKPVRRADQKVNKKWRQRVNSERPPIRKVRKNTPTTTKARTIVDLKKAQCESNLTQTHRFVYLKNKSVATTLSLRPIQPKPIFFPALHRIPKACRFVSSSPLDSRCIASVQYRAGELSVNSKLPCNQ